MTTHRTDWRARLGLTYTPSTYQEAIFDFVGGYDEEGQPWEGNAMAVAVAGAGKSTSLATTVRIATERSRFVLALAFNVEAKDELMRKLEGTGARVKTVHGHGYGAIGYTFGFDRVRVEVSKYSDFVNRYIAEFDASQTLAGDDCSPEEIAAIQDDGYPRAAILKLLDLARLNLLDANADDFGSALGAIARHHDVDVDPDLRQLVTDVVRLAMKWGPTEPTVLDYTDMVWLPTVLRLRPWTADWIFVDEAQDISKAHRELIRRSMKRHGRALFVGDPRQAIYGFAGADANSFEAIVEEFECTVLPLSVCYRCPTSVLDLAREIVPQIEARPGAPEGVVRSTTSDAFIDEARRGDMVLCRLNAPLLSLAFRLIGAGISAAVRGRADLGKGLTKIIDECTKRRSFSEFGLALDAWEDREKEQARKRYGKRGEDALAARLEAIADQAECIRVIWGASKATGSAALRTAIMSLFADDDPKVVLSSIHRAKGLEARRVFIAKPERLGVAWPNSQPWMVEQEKNLEYVAYTRAQQELVFLDGAPPEGDEDPEPGEEPDADNPFTSSAKVEAFDKIIVDRDIKPENSGPAPLPPVSADAPDVYDPGDSEARIALARRLDAALRSWGFLPLLPLGTWPHRSNDEMVYTRGSDVVCKVYSTIAGGEVRAVGQDSIKVSLTRNGKGIGRTRRVNRVGKIEAIVSRVEQRITSLTGAE